MNQSRSRNIIGRAPRFFAHLGGVQPAILHLGCTIARSPCIQYTIRDLFAEHTVLRKSTQSPTSEGKPIFLVFVLDAALRKD